MPSHGSKKSSGETVTLSATNEAAQQCWGLLVAVCTSSIRKCYVLEELIEVDFVDLDSIWLDLG